MLGLLIGLGIGIVTGVLIYESIRLDNKLKDVLLLGKKVITILLAVVWIPISIWEFHTGHFNNLVFSFFINFTEAIGFIGGLYYVDYLIYHGVIKKI